MSSKKMSIGTLTPVFMSIGGGFLGNQIANFAQKQSFMVGKEQYSPLIPVIVGIVGSMYAPKFKDVFAGMIAVSGTELMEKLANKATTAVAAATTQAQGRRMGSGYNLGVASNNLGFTRQVLPKGQGTLNVNGQPVR